MQILLLAMVLSQPPAVPLGPPDVPTGPPTVPMTVVVPKVRAWPSGDYVLFVKVEERPVGNRTTFRDDEAYERPGIYWISSTGNWRVADGFDPERSIREREGMVSRPAVPFAKFFRGRQSPVRIADVDSVAGGRWLPAAEQKRLFALWPKNIESEGFVFYHQTGYSQYIDNNNGRDRIVMQPLQADYPFLNQSPAINPNRSVDDWRVPGGLAHVPNNLWKSYTAVSLPDQARIDSFRADTPVSNAPRGALPKEMWRWPVGTIFADMLINAKTGELFELRMRAKEKDGWHSMVPRKNPEARPMGYVNAGQSCKSCHERPTDDASQYFINLRREDSVFSASPLIEGSTELDYTSWPISRR